MIRLPVPVLRPCCPRYVEVRVRQAVNGDLEAPVLIVRPHGARFQGPFGPTDRDRPSVGSNRGRTAVVVGIARISPRDSRRGQLRPSEVENGLS